MVYQQKFRRLTDKSCVVQKGGGGACWYLSLQRCFLSSIFLEDYYSSFFSDLRRATGYLPLSTILLIYNPFQMSYWLGEASLPFSFRDVYLQCAQLWSPNTCLQVAGGNDGDICVTQTDKRTFKWWNKPSGCHTKDPCVLLCVHPVVYFGRNSPMSSWTDGSLMKGANF